MYVALDLETTGFDKDNDRIIEFAAVKFDEDKIIEKYQTLISPGLEIPQIVTIITGIEDKDVENAPKFSQKADEIKEFIGDLPIVGHFIQFDTGFLNAYGMKLKNIEYDTCSIASMLMPNENSYSLEALAQNLGIEHKDSHRALDDTIAAAKLFQKLLKLLKDLPEDILNAIAFYTEKSNSDLKNLFEDIAKDKTPISSLDKFYKPLPSFKKNSKKLKITDHEILEIFDEKGLLANYQDNYEKRSAQVKFSNEILSTITEKKHLLAEAGTGTGKTLGYLLPLALESLRSHKKTIVSTNTLNLQDQIFKKDLKIVKQLIEDNFPDFNLNIFTLKGRSNYLSFNRLQSFLERNYYDEHEINALIKLLIWLPRIQNGEKEEISLRREEKKVWYQVCCDYTKDPEEDDISYLEIARKQAKNADIIITNHSLTILDSLNENKILPEYNYLVFDEGHNLEELAPRILGQNIHLEDLQKTLDQELPELSSKLEILSGLLGIFIENHSKLQSRYQRDLIIEKYHENSSEWQKVIDTAKNMKSILNDIELEQEVDHFLKRKLSSLVETLSTNDENHFIIISKNKNNHIMVKLVPVQIGNILKQEMFDNIDSCIITSATLTTNQNFNFIRNELQLDESFDEIILPNEFDYPNQVNIIIPEDIPEPSEDYHFTDTCQIVESVINHYGGKTLVLFTSQKTLERCYFQIIGHNKNHNILAQNLSGSRSKILELYKSKADESVLFGTNSFWEGVDLKGDLLKCVIIQKLPFDPPNDPEKIIKRSRYQNDFTEYSIPRAILKFKQGFGRLIRSKSDTGTIIILDKRIINKQYGENFFKSLPEGININILKKEQLKDHLIY